MTPLGESGDIPPLNLLAAYLDGELKTPSDRARVEAWIQSCPEACDELDALQRLRQAMRETRITEPPRDRWNSMFRQLREHHRSETAKCPSMVPALAWLAWSGALAAACVLVVAGVRQWTASPSHQPPHFVQMEREEVFPVAAAHEVEILSVRGDDTATLVVGRLPVHEPLELVGSDEITIMEVRPDAHDNMVPQFRMGGTQRPLIWARLESD